MTTGVRYGVVAGWVCLVLGVGVRGDDAPTKAPAREIPASFAGFEYLIGSWKGSARPAANPIRGWQETHAWSWVFQKGTPVGLSVELQGNKVLKAAKLTFDPATKRYTLGGPGADGKPVTFQGALDAAGKQLVLDRQGNTADGSKQRLTLFPNSNFVRYTLLVSEQGAGAPQFKKIIDTGLTKEGESFAAGGTAADLPKCIVTGGAAAMSVSYQGASYPLCCSGCRDEFNENPEKYIKKLRLRTEAGAAKTPVKAASNKDDGAFDGLGDEPKANGGTKKTAPGAMKKAEPQAPPESVAAAAEKKAASTLRVGQNLEKSGKTAAALGYYRQVVKDFPGTAAAKTAAERVKALGPK